jgi:carboxyl-terminal processing protease
MKLKLVGIGALLGVEDDICVVKEIVPGGPADLGRQLKPNDKIISVGEKGGEPVEIIGMKLRKIVDKIRGKKGTEVSLMVQPADAADTSVRREILITRDTVKLNSARARAGVFDLPVEEPRVRRASSV